MSLQPDADDTPVDLTANAAGPSQGGPFWSNPAYRLRLILIGIVGFLFVIIVLLLTRQSGEPSPDLLTPTPDDLAARPVSMTIKGVLFNIEPVNVSDGRWQLARAGADSAEWIYGTVVNYVVGVYPTDETTALADDLAEGDPIGLKMSNGAQFNFRMSGRQRVPADAVSNLFQQSRPGITIVLLGEGGADRLVITGLYDAEQEPQTVGEAGLTSVGTPVQIGVWRVTVLSGRLVTNGAGENPQQAFYFVDFTVEYLGADPISADTFDLKLIDGVRAEYIIDREVSSRGAYNPPGGLIAPRNPTSFTAGYKVSASIPGPSLTWVFKPTPDADPPARFEVPIVKPTSTPEPRTQIAVVNCCTAILNEDQTQIILSGGVGNPTQQTVTISQVDISLNTPDNVFSDLRTAEPPLPWVIEPSTTMAFRLEFTRPPGFTAVFRIVNQQFELSGLR
jgi:hypothetical protein